MILEDRWIERQPNERGTKEGDRDEAQTAMRHSMEEPKESKPFQGPSERDPLALKLERKNQTNEKQQRPTLPRKSRSRRSRDSPGKVSIAPTRRLRPGGQRWLGAAPSIR